ncbi:MAG TPA: ubiquinol-cytochrome c reductase iron-sulfur subunit [Prolixibacteraceae bacterium]|nr:ubiquinol-cytochrome c reductase iron-sulfur subunit [Prolixibacteraceae bacterium]
MERKNFIKNFAVGGSILLTSPALFTACSKDDDTPDDDFGGGNGIEVELSELDLDAVGNFDYKGNIIIIRNGENSYLALSKVCTHNGCEVSYNHSSGQLPCPCHGSVFSTSGSVINGPAETSLKSYSVKIEGDKLILT